MSICRLSFLVLFLSIILLPGAAAAQVGIANGKVCLIDTSTKGYGFSTFSGLWTSVTLDGPAETRLVARCRARHLVLQAALGVVVKPQPAHFHERCRFAVH